MDSGDQTPLTNRRQEMGFIKRANDHRKWRMILKPFSPIKNTLMGFIERAND